MQSCSCGLAGWRQCTPAPPPRPVDADRLGPTSLCPPPPSPTQLQFNSAKPYKLRGPPRWLSCVAANTRKPGVGRQRPPAGSRRRQHVPAERSALQSGQHPGVVSTPRAATGTVVGLKCCVAPDDQRPVPWRLHTQLGHTRIWAACHADEWCDACHTTNNERRVRHANNEYRPGLLPDCCSHMLRSTSAP